MSSLRLAAPCDAPVTSSVWKPGSSPRRARASPTEPAPIAARRIGIPTTRSAKFGIVGVGSAVRMRAAPRATMRFALPGVASRLTRRIGTFIARAADAMGPVT